MAQRSTVYKAELAVADVDRGYYADHPLTVARHPSETEERMMVRVLAFALHASEALAFGPGLSAEDEPDLVERDATGAIDLWIDVGLPDERLVKRACSKAHAVVVYAYGGSRADLWWAQCRDALAKLDNLRVLSLPAAQTAELAKLASRSMRLACTIQDRHAWFASDAGSVEVTPTVLREA
jgi:uncharacterized protein YaeQ